MSMAMCQICGDYAVSECSDFKHPGYKYLCKICYDRLMEEEEQFKEMNRSSEVIDLVKESMESFSETISEAVGAAIEQIEETKYNPDLDSNLTKIKISESPERWLNQIAEEYYDREVYIVKDNTRKDTPKTLVDILNERFVRKQLELNNRLASNRDMYYQILTRRGFIDLKGDSLNQQISLDGSVKSFCEKICDFFEAPYWGYIQEELTIMSTARTTAYSINGKEYEMSRKNITEKFFGKDKNEFYYMIRKTPFFFIICEKELVIMETMEALRDLGYTEGFLGFATQGYASTYLIKTLIEYKEIISDKFVVGVLHDLDVGGIKIFLNMKRYFHVESVGLNPEVMKRSGIDFTGKGVKYRIGKANPSGEANPAEITGAITMLKDLYDKKIIDSDEKIEYEEWVDFCSEERYELQAITGVRLDEDMEQNPARDYAEYIQHKLEDFERKWDINRLKEPRAIDVDYVDYEFTRPPFISKIIQEIQNKIEAVINEYLESKNLRSRADWRKLLADKHKELDKVDFTESILKELRFIQNKRGRIEAIRLRKKNKRYTESLKDVREVVNDQGSDLYDIYRKQSKFLRKRKRRQIRLIKRLYNRLPEFNDLKETLEKLQEQVEKQLDELEFEEETNHGE